jgi:hypothetical protein
MQGGESNDDDLMTTREGENRKAGRPMTKSHTKGMRRNCTPQKHAQEAGIDYTLSLQGVSPNGRYVYARQLRGRGFEIDLEDRRPSRAPVPVINKQQTVDQWVRKNIFVKSYDKNVRLPLRIKSGAVTSGGRELRKILPARQLAMWVNLWTSKDVEARLSVKLGLGLFARRTLKPHTEVARAVIDPFINDPTCLSHHQHGAAFGPLSLVNAACVDCANALFRKLDVPGQDKLDEMIVKVREDEVAPKAQLLVPYYQEGECMPCAKCGMTLTKANTELP